MKSACSAKPPPFCSRVRAVDGRAFELVVGLDRLVVLVERELLVVVFLLADEARRVLALLEVGVVAVQRVDVARAHVEVAAQRDRRQTPSCSPRTLSIVSAILGAVGPREDRFAVELEQVLGRRAVADEVRVDVRQAHVEASSRRRACVSLREQLLRLGRREIAPAVLVEMRRRDEVAEAVADRAARLGLQADAAERARR